MAGANYMGGKRYAARARISKSTERAQKRHFGSQRLNLAGNRANLGIFGRNEVTSPSEHRKKSGPAKSVVDIELAHVRQKSRETVDRNGGYIPAPIHMAPCAPKLQSNLTKPSEGDSSSSAGRTGHSKVPQALDTTEQLFLRSAMDSILSMPDLAGLSKCPRRTLKRRQSPCLREETTKRQRDGSPVSDMDSPRHESDSNSEEGSPELHFAFDVTEDYSSDTNQSAAWKTYPKVEAPSLSFSSRHTLPQTTLEGGQPTSKMISGNLFDYEDPWTALGVMLGVENTPHIPLRKRDFRKVLAEIPTPAPTTSISHHGRYDADDFGASNVHPNSPNDGDHRSRSTLPTRSGLPVSARTIDTNRNRIGNLSQILSPTAHSKITLPNILHSLLSYSSGASSGPPSSPSPRSQFPFDPVLGLRLSRGRQGSDKNTPPLARNATSSPAAPRNTSHYPLFSPILHHISGKDAAAGHDWQDASFFDADVEEGDADIASDLHISPEAVHHRSGSISPGFGHSSSYQQRQRQENFRGSAVSLSGSVAGNPFDSSMPYNSSVVYHSSQDDVNGNQEEANSDSLSSPMRFALPSNDRSDSDHDAFASLHSATQENNKQILDSRYHSPSNSHVYMPYEDNNHNNVHALQLVATSRPSTPASVLPPSSTLASTAADLLLSSAKTSSSTMHALKPPQLEPIFAPIATASTGARLQLDPRMKLSTELNPLLHAPSRSLTPLSAGQRLQATNKMYPPTTSSPIPIAITTPQPATRTAQALPSRPLLAMFSNSPSHKDHTNSSGQASAPTTAGGDVSHTEVEDVILQKRPHFDQSDIQAIISRDVVLGKQQRTGVEVVAVKAENESEGICPSLFGDDEVESDSD